MHKDFVVIGEVDLDLLEYEIVFERTIGNVNINKIGVCSVRVYNGEGQIPHFHIINKDGSFDCCICIYSNNYFSHPGHADQFSSNKQLEKLNTWLDQTDKKNRSNTNWETICQEWEKNNPECKFPKDKKVTIKPEYKDIKSTLTD